MRSQPFDDQIDVGGFVRIAAAPEPFFRAAADPPPETMMPMLSLDAGARGGVRAKRTSAGSSSHTSSQVATSAAPCFINVLGPQESLLVTLPGTARTSRPCSSAQRAVTRVPLNSPASSTSTPIDRPLMIRLRIGKFCGAGKVPSGNSLTMAPPESRIWSLSFWFSLG